MKSTYSLIYAVDKLNIAKIQVHSRCLILEPRQSTNGKSSKPENGNVCSDFTGDRRQVCTASFLMLHYARAPNRDTHAAMKQSPLGGATTSISHHILNRTANVKCHAFKIVAIRDGNKRFDAYTN
jgi:hypothetical protein